MIGVVEPDPGRRIVLPGVGPVPRPLEIGRDVTGFERLTLRGYRFDRGHVIDGEAEGDEVAIVLVQGRVRIDVADSSGASQGSWSLEGRATPFAAPARGVYLPPGFSYRLDALEPAEVAYARSPNGGGRPSMPLRGERVSSDAGVVEFDVARGAAAHLTCVETYVDAHRAWCGVVDHDAIWWVRTERPGVDVRVRVGEGGHVLTCGDGAALVLPAGTAFELDPPDVGIYLLRFGAHTGLAG